MSDATDHVVAVATPLLRVVRGEPTAEELAAVTAVLLARAAEASASSSRPGSRPRWSRGSGVRHQLPAPGPGAWRASGWPR